MSFSWTQPNPPPPDDLVDALRAARRIVAFTGAGMSAESGIPTFRDTPTGLWAQFDLQAMATRKGYLKDPARAWGWYTACRAAVRKAVPHDGHTALVHLASLPWIEDVTVVTQNVDDLHERSGSGRVIHVHGSLFAARCIGCRRAHPPDDDLAVPESSDVDAFLTLIPPPRCPACGACIRPDVVWFGEELPGLACAEAIKCAQSAALMLVVGTSGLVYPAAALPSLAATRGCIVWHVNPDNDGAHRVWKAAAASALPALLEAVVGGSGLSKSSPLAIGDDGIDQQAWDEAIIAEIERGDFDEGAAAAIREDDAGETEAVDE